MTATNPHPFANPLNQSRFRNFSYGIPQQQKLFSISRSANPKDFTVPDSTPYSEVIASQQQSQLTVPNSDIPYYNGPVSVSGFLGRSSLLKLSDGSILDLKACKIVLDPNKKWKAQGYWNDPCGMVEKPQTSTEWGQSETIEQMLSRIGKPDGTCNDPNLDPASIAYWQRASEESKKLEQNLTDEQKKLIDQLQSGKLFPLTKLVDES